MKPQELLKNWLRRNKMTAKDLADRAGTNHSGVYRYLNGDTDSMRTSTAFILAKATGFELDVCDLLGIQPRIVFRCPKGCEMDLHESKNESAPYNRDVSARRVNTPSSSVGRVSTNTELLTQVKKSRRNALVLLEHWALAFHRSPKAVKLTDDRKKKIKKALENFSVDDLKRCIDGYASSHWRQVNPQRHELATLLRKTEQIEAGLVMYRKSGLAPPPPVDDSWVARQQEQEAFRETQNGN